MEEGSRPSSPGHDAELTPVTAAPVQTLRTLPLKRLKEYLAAYDIPAVGVKEKEDLVEAVLKARNPATGTLGPAHEAYYRRKSVPGARRRAAASASGSARPNATRPPPPRQPPGGYPPGGYAPPPRPPPHPYAQQQQQYQQQYQYQPRAPRPAPQQRPPPPRPQPAPKPKPAPKAPPPPVPTLLSLVPLPRSYLATLSIGTLKAVLYENHVRVDFSQVLEKSELVTRVAELVADERRRLERQRQEEEREEREARERSERAERGETSPGPRNRGNGARGPDGDLIDLMDDAGESATDAAAPADADADADAGDGSAGSAGGAGSDAEPKPATRTPTGPQAEDRGLCVVCQDEEATLAVVDCGHLAMCARECFLSLSSPLISLPCVGIWFHWACQLTPDCSDLVMATTRVCPMCRTRIVTPQRLIRIYRV